MVCHFLAYYFTPANQSRAEYFSDQQELVVVISHCRDDRS